MLRSYIGVESHPADLQRSQAQTRNRVTACRHFGLHGHPGDLARSAGGFSTPILLTALFPAYHPQP